MISKEIIEASKRQSEIDEAKAAFFAQGGKAKVIATLEYVPVPPRRASIDPETVLRRVDRGLTRRQRQALRKMAEGL